MAKITFQWDRIQKWPRKETPATARKNGVFKSGGRTITGVFNPATNKMDGEKRTDVKNVAVGRTYEELEDEIRKIGVKDGVVSIRTNIAPRDFARSTGFPVANAAQPDMPGVIVEVPATRGNGGGKLIYACDKFKRWQDNLRAIVLTLERLRLASLYGVLDQGEQYIGSRALPPPGASLLTPPMTVEAAAKFIARHSAGGDEHVAEIVVKSSDNYRDAYRTAAKKLHPDANDQTVTQDWHTLAAAKAVLDAHHGIK